MKKLLILSLKVISGTFHPKTMNFTFFSSARGTFSRIDHILGHKSSLDKLKKVEIIPSIFSDHNVVRLDVNYRKKHLMQRADSLEKTLMLGGIGCRRRGDDRG